MTVVLRLMKYLSVCIFFIMFFSLNANAYEKEVDALAIEMANKIAKGIKQKIAVVDFTDPQGNITELGRVMAEEFSVSLALAAEKDKKFKVVDRTHLKSIVKEHKLSASGLIDPDTARKLGKVTGVEVLVTGTLTSLGDSIRISVKALDTETAEMICATRGNIAKTEAINVLIATAVTVGTTPGNSNQNQTKPLQSIEAGGFIFQLLSCKLSNKVINCSLLITNTEKDKELHIHGGSYSRLFDYSGNEYYAVKAEIGKIKASNGYGKNQLISGIPIKAGISFGDISPKIKGIAVIEINCYNLKVQFRNVPMSKQK